jgi:DNA-binding LytR/AlgR family response regulator
MDKLLVFVVDDDPVIREQLCAFIEGCDRLQLVGVAGSAGDAVASLMIFPSDLIFVDVSLPDMDGFRMLSALHRRPKVVMLSVDASRAVDAFDAGATDFLLKPISQQRFLRAVERVLHPHGDAPEGLSVATVPHQELELKCGQVTKEVRFADIRYVQAMGNYLKVYLANGHLLAKMTMKEIEAALPAEHFMRVHRSFLVALNAMESLGSGSTEVQGRRIPVGVRYRIRVKARLDAMRSRSTA